MPLRHLAVGKCVSVSLLKLMTDPQVEKGDALTLVEQSQPGVCGSECKTIAKAAADALGDLDTDLGELLWKVQLGSDDALAVAVWVTHMLPASYMRILAAGGLDVWSNAHLPEGLTPSPHCPASRRWAAVARGALTAPAP